MWLVYRYTNQLTGKIYVGYTSKTLDDRWRDHVAKSRRGCQRLYAAMRRDGLSCWHREILEKGIPTLEEVNAAEQRWICELQANDPNVGYNMTPGGDGGTTHPHNEHHRLRMSSRMKGAANPRAKLSQADVDQIRVTYAKGDVLQRELAEQYGVTQVTISGIITRRIWRGG